MKIVVAGGTGFIGKKLTDFLVKDGHKVTVLTRKEMPAAKEISFVPWLKEGAVPEKDLEDADVFINLAGVSINAGRWTKKHQREIYQSRMDATDELLRIIDRLSQKPSVFINASAIGIYPPSNDAVYTEESREVGQGFLAKTAVDWENKAKQVENHGIRPVFMRFGVVLGNEGGALPLMTLPYKLFVGGTVGSGDQWVSWVHIGDVVRAILFAIENKRLRGPVNVTAPSPVRMEDFCKTIGAVLRRPHWFPVPSIIMKLALGEKSKLVLEGQKVMPKALLEEGFEFLFPDLESALKDLFSKT